MNEKRMEPMANRNEMETRLADGNLFDDDDAPTIECYDDASEDLDDIEETPLPNLKLSRGDESAEIDAEEEELVADTSDADDDRWPWDSDIAEAAAHTEDEIETTDDAVADERRIESDAETDNEDEVEEDAADDSPLTLADEEDELATVTADLHDHSAIEDVVLSTPVVQTPIEETLASFARKLDEEEAAASAEDDSEPQRESAQSPARAVVIAAQSDADDSSSNDPSNEAAASIAVGQPRIALTPKRIGSGQLIPARLTWRPGDPFGDIGGSGPRRFRWDVMLTSAGVTAACGLACIWLLRTLLA